jgi:dienelactone hydrolase
LNLPACSFDQDSIVIQVVVMAGSKKTHWSKIASGLLAAVVLASGGLAADRAGADVIKKEDMLRGVTTTRAQCVAIEQAVWLNVYGQEFCVRYYLSTAGGEGSRPVVFWNGDSNGPLAITRDRSGNVIRRAWTDPSKAQDVDTAELKEIADAFSKMAKTTAIYIGRIGVEGTSGNHMSRKTLVELQLMNAALDAIKRRYEFEGFHLAGQSGGSRLVFALSGMRRDVGCAVSGSGQLTTQMASGKFGDPGTTYFDLMDSVPLLAQNRAVRLMMITDPADQQVPAAEQTPMVDKMRQAGRLVPQFFVESTDAKHHGVLEYTRLAMAGCVLGKPDADIARAVGTITRRNAEINQRKRDEAKTKTATSAMAREPGRS